MPNPTLIPPLAAALLLAVVLPAPAASQRGSWRPDERILVSDFSEVSALATDQRRVFAATGAGIAIYDVYQDRWLEPITVEDGYPLSSDPTALAFDGASQELWLATVDGRVLSYAPFFGTWEDRGSALAPPVFEIELAGDATGSVYLLDSGGWSVLEFGAFRARRLAGGLAPPRGSRAPDPLDDPFVRARGRTLTVDETGRSWPVSDAVSLIGSPDVWIGSYGGYLFRYRDFAGSADHFVYGVPGRGVRSLATGVSGIWFGADGRSRRRGIARAGPDLDGWLIWEGRLHGAPNGAVNDLLETAGAVWAAANDGVYRMETDGGRWRRLSTPDGLPHDEALALASDGGGVWVGTRRGAVFLTAAGDAGALLAQGARVTGIAVSGPDVWLASDRGVLRAAGAAGGSGSSELVRLGASDPRLGGPALSIAAIGDAVYAAFANGVYRVAGPQAAAPPLGPGGREARLRVGGGRLWLVGSNGAQGWDPGTGDLLRYVVGADVPLGPVTDVAPTSDGVWLATPLGALLLRDRR